MCQLFANYKAMLERHLQSAEYRDNYSGNPADLRVPDFCPTASAEARILAILQDPGRSGAEVSGRCSLDNQDSTAENLRNVFQKINIDRNDVIFWNFYAAINSYGNALETDLHKQFWADRLADLVDLLENLKVIVVCGEEAWVGFELYSLKNNKHLPFVYSTHPARLGAPRWDRQERVEMAWELAKRMSEN